MSGDGSDDVTIPAVFMKKGDASVLRELLQFEKSVYVLLTWLPPDGEGEEASKGEEDVKNDLGSGEESISSESKLNKNGMEPVSHSSLEPRTADSGLYGSGVETLDSNYDQRQRDSAQACSGTSDCNTPSHVP